MCEKVQQQSTTRCLGEIIRTELHRANFIFPKLEVFYEDEVRCERYTRVDNVKKSWETLKSLADVQDVQLKDFRTYFNWVLKTHYNFSSKEAGSYIGNSEKVNEMHYTPLSYAVIQEKMQNGSLNNVLGLNLPIHYV